MNSHDGKQRGSLTFGSLMRGASSAVLLLHPGTGLPRICKISHQDSRISNMQRGAGHGVLPWKTMKATLLYQNIDEAMRTQAKLLIAAFWCAVGSRGWLHLKVYSWPYFCRCLDSTAPSWFLEIGEIAWVPRQRINWCGYVCGFNTCQIKRVAV